MAIIKITKNFIEKYYFYSYTHVIRIGFKMLMELHDFSEYYSYNYYYIKYSTMF